MADWHSFRLACGRTSTASGSKTLLASSSAGDPSLACKGSIQPCGTSTCVPVHPPGGSSPPLGMSLSSHGLHLVDYSSSDESDHENVDITEDNPGLPQTQMETSDGPCETSARVLGCLSELREVVMRLHTRKLFPYNPAPLLRLLGQVEDRSLHSPE